MRVGGEVAFVESKSIAEEIGIHVGDRIISINGISIKDYLDFQYLATDTNLEIEVLTKEGEINIIEVEKELYEPLGVEFTNAIFDGIRRCKNNCIFCFMRQSPKNMRKTLYLRDDDYRLSLLQGNYITLTNISEKDWKKILHWKISPLYISVHTTNPVLRQNMMGNERAGEINKQLNDLAKNGIQMHIQIVLCPGINDGKELMRTLHDLATFWPAVQTVAIVPVGLTKYREGLPELSPVTKEIAREVIDFVEKKQKNWQKEFGTNFAFLADEFYILADRSIPPAEYYEGFPLLEDGIGLIRMFIDDFFEHAQYLPDKIDNKRNITIITGKAAAPYMQLVAQRLNLINGINVNVYPCENNFYGSRITVAGLLTAHDLFACDMSKLGDIVLLPEAMFKKDEEITLDNFTMKEIAIRLKREVKIVKLSGMELINSILCR